MNDRLECHNYTLGRRYPMVLGRIQDVVLPWPITMPQLAAGLVGLGVVLASRPVWRALLGDSAVVGLIVVCTAVAAPAWLARPTRIEGRSLPAAATGRVRLWLWPRRGKVTGARPVSPARRHRRRTPVVAVIPAATVVDADRAHSHLARTDVVAGPVWSSLS